MSKIILLLFFSFINQFAYSQDFKLGGAINILTGNRYLNYQGGPSLIADYSFKNIPISIQGVTRFYFISDLSSENHLSAGYSYTVLNAGASVNYYPIHWAIEPYIGLGIFYNFNRMDQDGNLGSYNNSIDHVDNNFSAEITGGIKFAANTSINFIVEVTQTINKPGYGLVIETDGVRTVKKERFNFNSLFLRLGLLFRICNFKNKA